MAECRPGMACFNSEGFSSMQQGGCQAGMSCGGLSSMGSGGSGNCRYGQNQNILICSDGTFTRGADNVFRPASAGAGLASGEEAIEIQNGGNGISAAPGVASASQPAGLRSFGAPNSVEPRVPCRLEQGDQLLICPEGTYQRGGDGIYRQAQAAQTFSAPAPSRQAAPAVAGLIGNRSHSAPTTSVAPAIAPRPIATRVPPTSNSLPSNDPVDSLELTLLGMATGVEGKKNIKGQEVQRIKDDGFVICLGGACSMAMTLAQVKQTLNHPTADKDPRPGRLLAGMGFSVPQVRPTFSARPFLRAAHNVAELDAAISANRNRFVVVTYTDPDNCKACRALEGKPHEGEPRLPTGQELGSLAIRLAGRASFISVDLDQIGSPLFNRFQQDAGNPRELPYIPFSILYERDAEGKLVPVRKNNVPATITGASELTTLLSNHGL